MKLTDVAIKQRVFTFMVFAAILLVGFTSLGRLALDFFPDISFPFVIIFTQHTGVGPEEMESSVTKVIEGAVAAAEGIDKLTATSSEGLSVVAIQFKWGTDLDAATADIRDKLDFVRDFLPEDATKPRIFRMSTANIPIAVLALKGNKPIHFLYDFADRKIQDRIEQIKGIASMNIAGGQKKEVHITLSRNRLDAYNLTPAQIVNILRAENYNASGGNIKRGYTQYNIRTQGEFRSLKEIRNVVVTYQRGVPVYLKYVADVSWGVSEKLATTKFDNEEALRLVIYKQSGANTVQAVEALQKRLEEIRKTLPKGVQLIEGFNTADFVKQSISSVSESGIYGALLAMLVVFFFLRNLRASIIIGVAIPISIVATFIIMYFSGVTLNIISMGGLALGIGMLVDNAIVVLENNYNYLRKGQKPAEAARLGSQEVAAAIFSSTLTTVCVFLPIVFTEGMAKELFKEMALTVTFSLLASLFVALTLVPMLSAHYLRVEDEAATGRKRSRWIAWLYQGDYLLAWLDRHYKRGIEWALDQRRTLITIVLILMGATVFILIVGVDKEFMPESDQGMLRINVTMPAGTRLETTDRAVEQLEQIVQRVVPKKHIKTRFFITGSSGGFGAIFGGSGSYMGRYQIRFIPASQRSVSILDYIKRLKPLVAQAPAPLGVAETTFSQQGGAMMGGGSAVDIMLRGYDLKKGARLASDMKKVMERLPNLYNIEISRKEGIPEMVVRINRLKAASLGLSVATIATEIQQSILGKVATFYRSEGREIDILVRLAEEDRLNQSDIENIQILSQYTRKPIRLGNVATIVRDTGPVDIERDNQERVIHITCSVFGGLQKAVDDIKRVVSENVIIPSGFSLEYAGSFKDMQDTFRDLILAVLVAIFLVYAVMASIFESFVDPFVIFFTFPLSIIGVVWALFFTGTSLSVVSFIGILVLAGVVVNNGIVMVDYINILRERGLPIREAIIEGGRRRLRPILMTTLTTVLALIPLAIGLGEGAESSSPLARSVIGGLTVSTFLSLLVLPVLYASVESLQKVWYTLRRDILGKANQMISGNFGNVLSAALLMAVIVGFAFGGPVYIASITGRKELAGLAAPLGGALSLILTYGFMHYVYSTVKGENPPLGRIFSGFKNFIALIMVFIISSILVAVGAVLLIVPAVIVMLGLSLSFFVLMDEGGRPIFALRRSWQLTKGQKGRLLLFVGVYLLLFLVLGVVVWGIGTLFPDLNQVASLLIYMGLGIVQLLLTARLYGALAVFYEERKQVLPRLEKSRR